MRRQRDVLGLLQRLGLKEGEARLSDGGDVRVVGVSGRLQRDMEDDGILGQLVEVGYRLDENGRGGRDGNQLAGANWLEDGKERVGILPDGQDLARSQRLHRLSWLRGRAMGHTSGRSLLTTPGALAAL